MVRSELPLHSASALASLIESKEASPVEVVEAYLQRIDDLDFKFNSYAGLLGLGRSPDYRRTKEQIDGLQAQRLNEQQPGRN